MYTPTLQGVPKDKAWLLLH